MRNLAVCRLDLGVMNDGGGPNEEGAGCSQKETVDKVCLREGRYCCD